MWEKSRICVIISGGTSKIYQKTQDKLPKCKCPPAHSPKSGASNHCTHSPRHTSAITFTTCTYARMRWNTAQTYTFPVTSSKTNGRWNKLSATVLLCALLHPAPLAVCPIAQVSWVCPHRSTTIPLLQWPLGRWHMCPSQDRNGIPNATGSQCSVGPLLQVHSFSRWW